MGSQEDLFETIIEQHKGILFKVALTYCKQEEDRQDLIQEIMVQIWQTLHRYNNNFSMSTWLYRISLNVAITYYRKNKVRNENFISLNGEYFQVQKSDSAEKEAQLRMLEKLISELQELDKALMLLYLDDKSHKEIAEILGISISNVSTKIGRIKEKLKINLLKQTI